MSLSELGLTSEHIEVLDGAIAAARGIVLVAGPSEPARAATLRGLLAHLATPERSVFAAEPEVTSDLPGISQTEVRGARALSEWLWAVVGADPDVIMVTEVPNSATAALLVRASRRAIVLAGVETASSTEALLALIGYGLPPRAAAAVVTCVVCRWDVPRLCPHCRHSTPAVPRDARHDRLLPGRETGETSWAAPGCTHCSGTGHEGTLPMFETVSIGTVVAPLLADLADHPALVRAGRQAAAVAVARAAAEPLAAGEIAEEDLVTLLDEHLTPPDP
jgi:type II secretory ATPase GspE/PulE/Tfp pilus assembly ATPase PilB-like protein